MRWGGDRDGGGEGRGSVVGYSLTLALSAGRGEEEPGQVALPCAALVGLGSLGRSRITHHSTLL